MTATDPDDDTLTYSVSDAVNFVIESDGQLKTLVMLDYETPVLLYGNGHCH